MTAPSAFRYEISEANARFAQFRTFVIGCAALFLLSSLSMVSAGAQEVSESTTGQQPKVETVSSSKGTPIADQAKKKASKYDVHRIGQRGIGEGINWYSLERERELGHELAEEVEMQTKLITDPVITEYVNRLGQRIVRHSDAQVPFTIKVIESDEISALALPGGYFYVNSGLILAADSEAELAGLMAHEIAHVAARHVTSSHCCYSSLPRAATTTWRRPTLCFTPRGV